MRGVAQSGVAPVATVNQRARPAVVMVEINVEKKKRSILSGWYRPPAPFRRAACSAQASAAVMEVVPTPPRMPCNPRIAIDGFLIFSLLIRPTAASVVTPRRAVRVGKYRGNQYPVGKCPALMPGNHFGRYIPASHRQVPQGLFSGISLSIRKHIIKPGSVNRSSLKLRVHAKTDVL